jgi:hypothetical protein
LWNRITGLIGTTGSGKSYTAAQIMEQCERAAVFQVKRIYEEPAFLHKASDVFQGNIREFCRALGESQFRYVYVCQDSNEEERNRIVFPDFASFIECCYERGRMSMFIDEAHLVCDPRYIPITFRKSVVMGRSRYIDVYYIGQRFAQIHHDITANSHEIIFWKITEPSDLEAIEQRCGAEVCDKVANLRATVDNRRNGGELIPGEFLRWTA